MDIKTEDIRRATKAGSWYPGDPTKLRSTIEGYFSRVEVIPDVGDITALISPHAGYQYSGQTAAGAYRQLKGRTYDVVVVLATTHYGFDFSSVYTRGGYETPLGIVPVDVPAAKAIADFKKGDSIRASDTGHLGERGFSGEEHSLELQLPFLQVALGDCKIVPVVMGNHNMDACNDMANAIAGVLSGKRVLVVASSDLTHAYSYDQVIRNDKILEEDVKAFDPERLYKDFRANRCDACGEGPIVATMLAAKLLGATESQVVTRTNSGDITGDRSSYVVGYISAIFFNKAGEDKKEPKATQTNEEAQNLSAADKKKLLSIARTSLEKSVRGGPMPDLEVDSPLLLEKRGGFVTLEKKGQLRGCVGYIEPLYPLAQTVQEMAKAAALHDGRFPPVTPDELRDIQIEISVLTPTRRIKDVKEIEVGKHGIIISKGAYKGLLLPQVAVEYKWDRNTFLEHTCQKAFLPPDAWKDKDTVIEIFSAEIFHE